MFRRRIAPIAIPLIAGVIGLTTVMNRPRFMHYHAVDVLQLIASGVCFGIVFTVLVHRR